MRLLIQDHTGHSVITEEEMTVEEMRRKFDELIAKSYIGYVGAGLADAVQVKEFSEAEDVHAEEIFFTAPLVGG
jgi:hypothetical protein